MGRMKNFPFVILVFCIVVGVQNEEVTRGIMGWLSDGVHAAFIYRWDAGGDAVATD